MLRPAPREWAALVEVIDRLVAGQTLVPYRLAEVTGWTWRRSKKAILMAESLGLAVQERDGWVLRANRQAVVLRKAKEDADGAG